MYLEKLQLNGFKSFAQKVELKFNRGITAIVGPNGSGKSNIADAIRWVLGEQSMKSIRGKKSEDVIFAGSSKKSRLGMAEVTLHFNNEDGQAPLDYSEIVLTRRFYRSGEGEYLINNTRSRLADIQMMMAQANVSSKTYSVIGQGQVDSVLVATPAERKDFFDEATGVKQYQIKRDQALNKLERTFENMAQGKLMLNEIKPRLRSLTRQVKRLEQKELVEKELESLQNYYYYSLWRSYAGLQDKLEKEKHELQTKLKILEGTASSLQEQMNQSGEDESMADEFSSLQGKYEDKQAVKQQLLRELALLEGRKDLDLVKTGGQDMVWVKRRQEEVVRTCQQKLEIIKELEAAVKDLEQIQAKKQQQQKELVGQLDALESAIKELSSREGSRIALPEVRAHLLGIIERLKQLQLGIKEANNIDEIKPWFKSFDDIQDSLSKLVQNLPNPGINKEENKLVDLRSKLESLMIAKEKLFTELGDVKVEMRVAQSRLAVAKDGLAALKKEKNQLESLISSQPDDSSGAENEVKAKLAEVDKELNDINNQLKNFNQVQQKKKEELLALQKKLQETQQKISELNRQKASLDIELAKLETKQEDLALEVHRELHSFMANLIDNWKVSPPKIKEKLEIEEVLEKVNILKKKKEMIGGIEPEAAEEYKEVKDRYDFLTAQVKDLTESMEKLKITIDDLDKIITKQFTENFYHINELFNKYFRMLFNGGRAELVLFKNEIEEKTDLDRNGSEGEGEVPELAENDEEEEDDLIKMYKSKRYIQGIDIKAVPPGKKMKSIGMLSGGERALTSIALICAIIANNPSPFVVLDEVDAALDEANSLRFAEIIADLAKQTQFIVITHNRATMEKADILYGVTMGRDGVSNFLSVKFEQAQEFANRY